MVLDAAKGEGPVFGFPKKPIRVDCLDLNERAVNPLYSVLYSKS